jgi:hypothetical protein
VGSLGAGGIEVPRIIITVIIEFLLHFCLMFYHIFIFKKITLK